MFTDPCYSDEFVAAVNHELGSGKTALQIWGAVYCHLHEIEGCGGLDTAPREYLLTIMEDLKIRGFERLAQRYGYNLHHYTSL